MKDRFRKWLIGKLGGFTESHMIWTKDEIYIGTSKEGMTKAEIDKITKGE